MPDEKPHHIRPMGKHKKIHVRAECDHCHKWECLTEYEDEVGKRDFTLGFFECKNCRKMFCMGCQPSRERFKCPSCGGASARKVRPLEIYVCGLCIRDWFSNRLCRKCDYETTEETEVIY